MNVHQDRNEELEIVELGVASVETKGGPGIPNEDVGFRPLTGLSDQ